MLTIIFSCKVNTFIITMAPSATNMTRKTVPKKKRHDATKTKTAKGGGSGIRRGAAEAARALAVLRGAPSPVRPPEGAIIVAPPPARPPEDEDFVPTFLPEGKGPVPPLTLTRFNESLKVGTQLDLSLLPEEKKDVWLKFLSNTVIHFHRETMALQGQLNEYRDTATVALGDKERADFVASVTPSIKTGMFGVFLQVIFASKVEVMTSKDRRALTSFGLTEWCGFATLVFRLIFKSQGTASKPINVGADSSSDALHPFDTPKMHE
jgi:hypothetical protein